MVLRLSSVKKICFSFFLVIISLTSFSQALAARLNVDESTQYYNVNATTIAGLRSQMQQRGRNGYPGYASWYVNWDRVGNCRNVDLNITYYLPRHTNPSRMSTKVRNEFNRFFSALRQHELNHGTHAKSGAQNMANSNCSNPQANLNWIRRQDINYDNRTNHGQTEGAWIRDV